MGHLARDLIVITFSILLAFFIIQLNLVEKLLFASENIRLIGSFVAGLFFTSVFTTVPAIVILSELSQVESVLIVALIGGLGAVCGDLLIFSLFSHHVADDFDDIISRVRRNPIKSAQKDRTFRWFGALVGAMIIASPLPDELGIAMMGISRLSVRVFVPISYVFNSLGIAVIGLISRLVA